MTNEAPNQTDAPVAEGNKAPAKASKKKTPAKTVTGYLVSCRQLGGAPYKTKKATSRETAEQEFRDACEGFSGGDLTVTEITKED